jgi:glutathione peroxidase-family protein
MPKIEKIHHLPLASHVATQPPISHLELAKVSLLSFRFLFFYFQKYSKKLGSNKCPLFTTLTKQNLIKILHNKLVKKQRLLDLLGDPPIQRRKWSHYHG